MEAFNLPSVLIQLSDTLHITQELCRGRSQTQCPSPNHWPAFSHTNTAVIHKKIDRLSCLMGWLICCINSSPSSTDFYLFFRYREKRSSSKGSLCIVNSSNTLHKSKIIAISCARYNHASIHGTPSNTTIRKTFSLFCWETEELTQIKGI